MVKKIERRGILRDGYVIKVQSLGQISIDNKNLPTPENILTTEAGEQVAHNIQWQVWSQWDVPH